MDGKSYVKQIIINYFISHSYLGRHAHIIPIFRLIPYWKVNFFCVFCGGEGTEEGGRRILLCFLRVRCVVINYGEFRVQRTFWRVFFLNFTFKFLSFFDFLSILSQISINSLSIKRFSLLLYEILSIFSKFSLAIRFSLNFLS